MNITKEQVLQISKHLTILHHTKGRMRISVSPKIKEMREEFEKLNISIDKAKELPKKIKGIKEFKLIALLGTITILYDDEIFPSYILEDLAKGANSEQVTDFINKLAKEAA
ncbi:MAG: hypothetical protein LBT96_01635 [Campylobacteraceae bacterium]|jgi:soluble cytochrome b562|nr:hypothetical protein [Campylobacteraceae bacterium]